MLTLSWRRAGATSARALALVVGLPALAQAQLFPNIYIQRERTPCPNEPPFYAHVRQNYYGYFPTCWRKFPQGWGCPCPNPEVVDVARDLRENPIDKAKLERLPDDIDRDRTGGAPPRTPEGGRRPLENDANIPPLPDLPGPLSPAPGRPDATPPTGPVPGRPGAAPRDPFDPLTPDLPRSTGPGASLRGPAPVPVPDGPALEPPQGVSAAEPGPPGDAFAGGGTPVLALPEMERTPAGPPADPGAVPTMPPTLPPDATYVEAPSASPPPPAQAPRRPSLIGGLINNMSNWRRR